MKAILRTVFSGKHLTRAEAARAMELVLDGSGTAPEQIAALLGALRAKGETIDEIAGIATAVRKRAISVPLTRAGLIDCCGTGGDGAGTFNVSTAAAFVLAGGGVGVAKHGNRAVSSACGSADVLEALKVPTDLKPEDAGRCIDSIGFGFLMAPSYHPALSRAGVLRRAIGVPTAFNLIGPLVNPALVKRQVVGVYDPRFLEIMARVLQELGSDEVLAVRGCDGLDEISLSAETEAVHLSNGRIERLVLKPEDAGYSRVAASALKGGDAAENARIIERLLAGERGPKRDIVALNAGAGFWIAGKTPGFVEGVRLAESVLDSGVAAKVLEKLRGFSGGAVS